MGIMPKPFEAGDDCFYCWAAGKTPLYLKCFFSSIKVGELWLPSLPLPPNGYWDLVQKPLTPCVWTEEPAGPPDIVYRVGGPTNFIRFTFQPGVIAFNSIKVPGCANHFHNDYTEWGDNIYYGGYCYLETSHGIQQEIEAVTPMIDPDPRMECFPMANDEIVVRYAGKRDGTKLYIKIDTSL